MANNESIYNAVIAGAGGASQERWITTTDSAAYDEFKATIEEVATAVDADIPTDTIGASKQALMQSICQGVFSGRFPTLDNYADIAAAIVALYTSLEASLFPDVTPGGGFPIFQQAWLDTTASAGGNGSIGSPFSAWTDIPGFLAPGASQPWLIYINQDVDAIGVPIPDLQVGGHATGAVKFQGVLGDFEFGPQTVLSNLSVDTQDVNRIHLSFQTIEATGLSLPGGTVYLTGLNSTFNGVSQGGTVTGSSNLFNCVINSIALDSWDLRMWGGEVFSANQIDNGFLDGVWFQDSASIRWNTVLNLTNCRFRNGVQLLCSSGQALNVDLDTWGAMRAAGVTFPDTTPTLTITPWMPIIANKAVVSTDGINPGDSVLTVGQMVPAAEPDSPCITQFKVQVNSNLSIVGSFIDPVTGALNVILRNTAGTTQNLTNPTYTVTYLPRVTP